MIRKLTQDDQQLAYNLFVDNLEVSFFLASNITKAPMVYDADVTYSGDYYGQFDGGNLIAVVQCAWNDGVLVCAPQGGQALLEYVLQHNVGSRLSIICGADQNVTLCKEIFNVDLAQAGCDCSEVVMTLELKDIVTPDVADVGFRIPTQDDSEFLTQWLCDFDVESFDSDRHDDLYRDNLKRAQSNIDERQHVFACVDGRPVAYAAVNASIDGHVQIGPVWTPPENRCNGYARAAVAALLKNERNKGVRRSLLFTDTPEAIKAYEAVGFRDTGIKYGLCIFKQAQEIRA